MRFQGLSVAANSDGKCGGEKKKKTKGDRDRDTGQAAENSGLKTFRTKTMET